ncbi:MAG TPA: hypothetical protein DDZ83_09495 [Nitrospinae bacterium]|nr:hypothetical protein [Nitrospinota bacterium]
MGDPEYFRRGGSFEVWAYVRSDGEVSFGRIIGKGSGNGVSQPATHSEPGGFVKLQFVHTWDGNDYATNTDSVSVSLNAWHHIVVTYNYYFHPNEVEKGRGSMPA